MKQKTEIFPQDLFGDLTISRTLLHIRYLNGAKPEGFTGSAWRGVLGPGLQRILCPYFGKTSKVKCFAGCSLQDKCPFFCLFRKKSTIPGKTAAPKGYILYSCSTKKADGEILEVSLFGDCSLFLQSITQILQQAGRKGLTHQQCQFEIVRQETLRPFIDRFSEPFTLKKWLAPESKLMDRRFISLFPIRLLRKNRTSSRKNKEVLLKMDWTFFFMTLVRRLEALNCIYNKGSQLERETITTLEETFKCWDNITDTLKFHDLQRYSSTQNQKIPLDGLVGEAVIKQCTPVQYSWLQAASLAGVGKSTVMGLGKIVEKPLDINSPIKTEVINVTKGT